MSKIIPISTCNNCNDVLSYKVNEPKRALSKFEYLLQKELRRGREEVKKDVADKNDGDERRERKGDE